MTAPRSIRSAIFVAALVGGAIAGCITPSVPVPPPSAEAQSFAIDGASGTATYQGSLGSDWTNSWVVVLVERTGDGVVARSDATGVVAPTDPFLAVEGDIVNIEYERDDGERAALCLILHPGPSSSNYECTQGHP